MVRLEYLLPEVSYGSTFEGQWKLTDLTPVEHLGGASNGGLERMSAGPVSTHVALLRGVNVGGKNKLPMEDLRAMFTLAGCEAVVTYIQSGNVVFKAGAELATLDYLSRPGPPPPQGRLPAVQ